MPSSNRALSVASGILASRLAGFLRGRAVAYYFGVGPFADVFATALRAPNALQVLLGEGTLSASFIPVYVRLVEAGRKVEAGRFAGAVLGLLIAVTAAAVLLGMAFAGPLVALLTPGYLADAAKLAAGEATADRFALSVTAVRIVFPMTGFLVLSVWALGVLNSHRRFFLAYFAPVLWNAAIIAGLLAAGRGLLPGIVGAADLDGLLEAACWGALAGGVLQLAVQLPAALSLLGGLKLSLSPAVPGVRDALAAFGPVVAGRGVVQLAGYLDLILASLLATGAVAALANAQVLYLLPISLFGMSVAAAELPELARAGAAARDELAGRLSGGVGQVAFLTVPAALGYLAFGFLVVGALYRTGRFGEAETWLVTCVLAGYALGLPASTCSRLLQNTFYALSDSRTPARIAGLRVLVAALAAVPLMLWLDRFTVPGSELRLGAVGLTLAASLGAWLELARLRAALAARIPELDWPWRDLGRMLAAAALAALPAAGVWRLAAGLHPALAAALVLVPYAGLYLALARWLGLGHAKRWLGAGPLGRWIGRRGPGNGNNRGGDRV